MIRAYQAGDQFHIKRNHFSSIALEHEVFMSDRCTKHTLEENGEVKAIICWWEQSPRHYCAFIVMVEKLEMRHLIHLKKFLIESMKKYQATVCTYSHDCDILNRWHAFIGMALEGVVELNGQKFNVWVMRWDGKQ